MSQTKLKKNIAKGDFVTREEASFDRETDLVSRCETAVNMVVKKVFTLQEALDAYELSFEQYLGYIMLNQKSKAIILDNSILISMIGSVLKVANFTESKLSSDSKKLVKEMREFATAH